MSFHRGRSRLVRELAAITDAALAEKFGVSRRVITGIASFETWKHVP